MNSRHNLLLQIAVITLLSRLPWVASQVWWVRADPPWNLKIYKIPRKIFLIVRRVRKFIFKISHKWDKLPPWSCWNLFQKHELKWMGWWEHKTLRYALKIMKTKFIFFMFSSSHSCMWPSVSCSHAPNNWIKLWSAARLQTITMSACAIYRHAPPGVTHEQWHQWSGSRPHFQFILLQIWVGREPHAATWSLAWSAPAHTSLTKTGVGHFSFQRVTFTGGNSEERPWWDICARAMIVNAFDNANIDTPCLPSDWGLFSWCTIVQRSAPGAWWCPPAPGDLTWGWLALVTTLSEDQTKHSHHSVWLESFSHERSIFMKCK